MPLVSGYSDLLLKTPDCLGGVPIWRAHFKLESDVSELFPYINAVAENAAYHDSPHHIQFLLDGVRCALYPAEAYAIPFADREEAGAFVQRLIDFLNDLYDRRSSLKPNDKKYEPIPVMDIFRQLPRTNCGTCGFSTCMAFAAALSQGEAGLEQCPDISDSTGENADKLRAMFR